MDNQNISYQNNDSLSEVLVDTSWVENNIGKEDMKIIEVDYDPKVNYEKCHIPGSVLIRWKEDLNNPLIRDILNRDAFQNLLRNLEINKNTTVVLYGDFNNKFATFAFWIFKYYRYNDIRLLDGGRKKWIQEGRELSSIVPSSSYSKGKGDCVAIDEPDKSIRALYPYVIDNIWNKKDFRRIFIDARTNEEYNGKILSPPEYPLENPQRGGHIPGAINIPWDSTVNDDGTFKSKGELTNLYQSHDVTPEREIITYCRIGERSSHTWFVLKYLLGYPNVKNYDGSWTEWGNIIGNPIDQLYNKTEQYNFNKFEIINRSLKRSFRDWWNTIPIDLRKTVDIQNNNSNSIVQKINHILLQLPNKDLKPSLEELQYWINTNQI